ncbi:hypothetical protein BP00DRAFT_70813 [Aspergillus indologenus CBS 114.80]|uniref:Uncharacterized protein n=1 Tax=Aspergillus indologenus CBS 114.80 TaxID=1450541 RepID=A0A2V5HNW2_9EURO|nr:hypothetical protein BP00DRAFT_70813 [Aspergillus indologenus CBS 114.80]
MTSTPLQCSHHPLSCYSQPTPTNPIQSSTTHRLHRSLFIPDGHESEERRDREWNHGNAEVVTPTGRADLPHSPHRLMSALENRPLNSLQGVSRHLQYDTMRIYSSQGWDISPRQPKLHSSRMRGSLTPQSAVPIRYSSSFPRPSHSITTRIGST